MSRSDAYVGGSRSPRGVRLPTVDRSPTRATGYAGAGSPLGHRKALRSSRSGNNSPSEHVGGGGGMVGGGVGVGGGGGGYGGYQTGYYRDEDLEEQMLEERGRPMAVGPGHHRSRSATRPTNPMSVRYQSLDRGPTVDHDREFLPIRDRRDRSLDRALYFEDDPYSTRSARQSPTSHQPFIGELQHQNSDLQRDLANLKKELDLTNQKLGSSMHSIKTFWSPELKKERALRKEESAKYSLINDQLKLLSSENQKQAMLVRQLEEELRMRMRGPSIEIQQQMEALYQENDHLQREIAILRDTIKVTRE
ncbi:ELKS/Rab6-interacting/CAST family member 1-like [Sitophilus oryzae]|uniref:ELKS/Rab6-interacting/CAST family member 1-like n=1 Tax=Sitophilus oryzae TaxID=7048 RepID=A0A6J2XAG6_SITOR|nr:ELKS/Rab6-interacting/CAST family member 1-like [Sitophilus oryzae]